MTPHLTVIIVNFNTRGHLAACLASLNDAPPVHPHRVVVVDNGSTDGSVDYLRQTWPKVDVLRLDKNAGFAAANNAAIRASTSSLVLLLNSDTVVPAGAIDALVARLVARDAVAAGPRLVDAKGQPEVSFGRMLSPAAELAQSMRVRMATGGGALSRAYIGRHVAHERFVDWVSGACLLVRRDAAVSAGLLDERYFMYEEDVDFCAALRARGGRVLFTPAATVVHLRGGSRPGTPGPSAEYDRSHMLFYEKHRPRWAPVLRVWQRLRGRISTVGNSGDRADC